jgi:hypothetical protein
MGEKRNAYTILVGKLEGKRPLGRPRRRWVDNIKIVHKEIGWDRIGGDEKGSLKSETVKYGRESLGTQNRERLRWQGPAAYIKDGPVLSSERAPHRNKTVTVKQ